MNGMTIRTFLAANSGEGFFSLYSSFLNDNQTIVIKGGPGSGKSGLMKKIASKAVKKGYFVEYCYCSSDAESLDAIRIPQRKLCVVDGTPPHTIEPKFPGAKDEIVYTGQFWDNRKLRNSITEIQDISQKITECFARAYRYLAAAGNAVDEVKAAVLPNTDKERISSFAEDLWKRHSRVRKGESVIYPRFLSGITPQGLKINRDTIYTLAEKVYVLDDPYRISSLFLEAILNKASEAGQEIYVFYDPLCPSVPQHVAFPEEGIAFVTSNKIHSFEPQNAYKIHLNRFLTLGDATKERCRRAERLILACLNEAKASLKEEKALHDDLEEFYVEAMDFKKLNAYTAKLVKTLF
ncbi:MAG: hypothetical protein J6B54_05735 [Clostridia bacterium]|nr:hypothetical protein [Clostridia bacterium]